RDRAPGQLVLLLPARVPVGLRQAGAFHPREDLPGVRIPDRVSPLPHSRQDRERAAGDGALEHLRPSRAGYPSRPAGSRRITRAMHRARYRRKLIMILRCSSETDCTGPLGGPPARIRTSLLGAPARASGAVRREPQPRVVSGPGAARVAQRWLERLADLGEVVGALGG